MTIITLKKGINFCYGFLFFILFTQISYAQLPQFSLSVTAANEACENNGALSFSVSGIASGATVLYSIYALPNITTAIGVTSGSLYSGLTAGNYRVVATQSLGTESNSQQQDITVLDQMVELSYQLAGGSFLCENMITVNVQQGIAVSYEIISGPVLKPLQASNVFTGLPAGVYVIRVFDSCGDGITQTYTLMDYAQGGLQVSIEEQVLNEDCNIAIVEQKIEKSNEGNFVYPVTITCVFTLPDGTTMNFNQVLQDGSDAFTISNQIPLTPDASFSYTITITDGCGNVFNGQGDIGFPDTEPHVSTHVLNCNLKEYKIWNGVSAVVTDAPDAYQHSLPHTLTMAPNEPVFILHDLPPGTYEFTVIDNCGQSHTLELTVVADDIPVPTGLVLNGCNPGFGSVNINSFYDLVNVKILQAPSSAGFSLPYDVSFNIDNQSANFWMNSLPQGTYVFQTTDVCSKVNTLTYTVGTYQQTATVIVMENCGSFDIKAIPSQNSVPNPMTYWLQKYNPVANTWGHPLTGIPYLTELEDTNSIVLTPNVISYNIAGYGQYRVLGRFNIFGNGTSTLENCIVLIQEFDFIAKPKVNNVVSISCQDGTYDVLVDAFGVAPFQYKILTKNGFPFEVDNSTSSLFLGVEAAVYGFEVEDSCGNILNAEYEIGNSNGFPIEVNNLCAGQNVSLSVLSFPFLSYEWWKDNDTTTLLGTSSTLNFTTFNPIADSGVYHVRVYYPDNPASCINFISDVEVVLNAQLPEAGIPTHMSYCGSPGQLDLFGFLSNYDTGGTWEEITNSGKLSENYWDATDLHSGSYQFRYTISDNCNNTDEAVLNIFIKPIPETPQISVNPVVCTNAPLELFASTITAGTYQWSGPNGFISTEQNPVIENPTSLDDGVYTLKILLNGCESEMVSTAVNVKDYPNLMIAGGCENNEDNYILRVFPLDNSFNTDEVSYAWTGPEGFTSDQNPITITNYPIGVYAVTVTNPAGCSFSQEFNVTTTRCRIPKGISPNNDGANDSFDLSGFDILNLKIYSRYGRLVYEKENYKDHWHGQDYKNRELPDATYYYYILLRSGEERVGWVYKTN